MAKYSQEFKRQVVHHYLSNSDGTKKTANLFNLSISVVRKWIAIHEIHGEGGLRPCVTNQAYSVNFKLDVIKAVMDDGLSYSQALVKFELKEIGMISTWLRLYQQQGIQGLQPKRRGRPKGMPQTLKASLCKEDSDKSQAELLDELNYLRAENAFLKKLKALRLEQEAKAAAEQLRLQDSYQD